MPASIDNQTQTGFQDHFSARSAAYQQYRPRYPAALFAALASAAPARGAAWDVGCGNGQASVALAEHFAVVHATDASAEQIASAEPHERVHYAVALAEQTGLPASSIDLVLVAQALHWFNFERFHTEAQRVARPGAVICAIAYELAEINPAIDTVVRHFYKADIGPYWPADRAHIETGYRDIPWPYPPLHLGSFAMRAEWTLNQFIGYLGTWSAVARYRSATGADPLPAVEADLSSVWTDPGVPRKVEWPLVILSGRLDPGNTGQRGGDKAGPAG